MGMKANKRYYIYKITLLCGSLAGKYYYGKRKLKKGIDNPMGDGYFGSGTIIKQYYKKYPFKQGVTAIKEILELNDTEDQNREREIFYIGDKYETDPNCLNLRAGGNGGVMSEKSRKKESDSLKQYYQSENGKARRKKMSDYLKGKPSMFGDGQRTEQHKKNISIALKGKPKSEEAVKKQSASMKGKSHPQSEETRMKISEALKGRPSKLKGTSFTEEHKRKIAETSRGNKSRTGMQHSEETKAKMRESAKKRWAIRKAA